MTVQEIADTIYSFDGNTNEWLEFEQKMNKEMEKLSESDIELLTETEAVEHLLMICDGIRFEQKR